MNIQVCNLVGEVGKVWSKLDWGYFCLAVILYIKVKIYFVMLYLCKKMYSEKRRVTDEIKQINKCCLYFLVPGCSEVQKCQCQLNGRRPPETVWVS